MSIKNWLSRTFDTRAPYNSEWIWIAILRFEWSLGMNLCTTFFAPSCFKVISLVEAPDHFLLDLKTVATRALCPLCQKPSKRIRSVYTRKLSDLPIIAKRLKIRLLVRRFYCDNTSCKRRIFCERVPQLASAYARCSSRLTYAHLHIALASGGETGAQLSNLLGMPSSPDTLLRRLALVWLRGWPQG